MFLSLGKSTNPYFEHTWGSQSPMYMVGSSVIDGCIRLANRWQASIKKDPLVIFTRICPYLKLRPQLDLDYEFSVQQLIPAMAVRVHFNCHTPFTVGC